MKISAIIVALNESEFIEPCIKAIYPFVDRIKIQTNYDRSWSGEAVSADTTIQKILEIPDTEGKISLHISRIPDEAIARNWLMRSDGYLLDHIHKSTTSTKEKIREFCEVSDYFWVIDGDEIYDPNTIPKILEYLESKKPQMLRIRGVNYFKTWNYQVVPSDNFYQLGFMKPGFLFRENRNILFPSWFSFTQRIINNKYWKLRLLSGKAFESSIGLANLPEEIAVFHHGAYVGDDKRISKKIFFSVHYDERMKIWYETIWKQWTPKSTNLHPLCPEIFKGLEYIPTDKLPCSIKNQVWSDGYIDIPVCSNK
jgi:hypothetical protein